MATRGRHTQAISLPSNGALEPTIVGSSAAMQTVRDRARRIAPSPFKVLITGESGVGKDLVARYIHAHSQRAAEAYVAVNCAGLSESLIETELFGHVKGSFTGAYRDKSGKLQLADGGTVFLDEIGEMSPRMQALLLRFLENGEIHQVGSDRILTRVDVRVIAATNRDLQHMVDNGTFRHDLLYRIRVGNVHVPSLQERPGDIRELVEYFTVRAGRPMVFTDAAWQALERYNWPGNVRELQNTIEQLLWLVTDSIVDLEHLPPMLRDRSSKVTPIFRGPSIADELYAGLISGRHSFWDHVHVLFLNRDIARQDLRDLVRHGLTATNGSYRALVTLFGLPAQDYKRFMNFLNTHQCLVDFREFRHSVTTRPLAHR
ncbi:MAG: sigma 54-interacting transcriptional regulator [Acidobacteriota bacterium]